MKDIAINTRLDDKFIFVTVSFAAPHPDGPPSKLSIEIQLARRDDYTLTEIEQMALKKANEALRIVRALDVAAAEREAPNESRDQKTNHKPKSRPSLNPNMGDRSVVEKTEQDSRRR